MNGWGWGEDGTGIFLSFLQCRCVVAASQWKGDAEKKNTLLIAKSADLWPRNEFAKGLLHISLVLG